MANPTHFTLHNRWMRDMLADSVHDWIKNSSSGHDVGLHGLVIDKNYSFFCEGTLLTTYAFNSALVEWAPVLYTWIAHPDTEHYRPHIRYLNQNIIEAADCKFDPKLLSNVCLSIQTEPQLLN